MKDGEYDLEKIYKELRENIEPEAAEVFSMLEGIMQKTGAFEPEVQEGLKGLLRQSKQAEEELERQREYYQNHPQEKAKQLAACRRKEAIFLAPSQRKTRSKLGGIPDGFPVPVMACGNPMRLLAQIVCSEVPGNHSLPKRGTLYFFCDPEPLFYGPNTFRVLYSPETPERAVRAEERSIRFAVGPCYEFEDCSLGIDDDEWKLSEHWLFGTSGWSGEETLSETAEGNWLMLLRLGSDDDLGWLWSDCGILCFFIHQEDLALGDFSRVRAEVYSG